MGMNDNQRILEIPHCGFGDLWAFTNYVCGLDEPLRVHKFKYNRDFSDLLIEMQSFLVTDKTMLFTEDSPNEYVPIARCFRSNYIGTKERWMGRRSGRISYQFDGRSDKEIKQMPTEEEEELLNWLSGKYKIVDVGNNMPMNDIIHNLANSEAFLGIPSGISHLANSVGLPVVIIMTKGLIEYENNMDTHLDFIYGNKPNMCFYRGARSLMRHAHFVQDFMVNRRSLIDGSYKSLRNNIMHL